MRQEDKRLLREQLIDLLETFHESGADPELKQLAKDVHARHKGQIAMLDEDTAKAVQLLEDIAYAQEMPDVPAQQVTDVLAQLRASKR